MKANPWQAADDEQRAELTYLIRGHACQCALAEPAGGGTPALLDTIAGVVSDWSVVLGMSDAEALALTHAIMRSITGDKEDGVDL